MESPSRDVEGLDFCSRLPPEIGFEIFKRLDAADLANCSLCCSLWRDRIDRDEVWLEVCRRRGLPRSGGKCSDGRGQGLLWSASFNFVGQKSKAPNYAPPDWVSNESTAPENGVDFRDREMGGGDASKSGATDKDGASKELVDNDTELSIGGAENAASVMTERFRFLKERIRERGCQTSPSPLQRPSPIQTPPSIDHAPPPTPTRCRSFEPCFWRRHFARGAHLDANWRHGRYADLGVARPRDRGASLPNGTPSLGFSRRHESFVTGGVDSRVRVWDVRTMKTRATLDPTVDGAGEIVGVGRRERGENIATGHATTLRILPDQETIVLGCSDGRLRLCCLGAAAFRVLCASVGGHAAPISMMELAPIDRRRGSKAGSDATAIIPALSFPVIAVTVASDNSVCGWRVTRFAAALAWSRANVHDDDVECCACAESVFVTGSWDRRLVLRVLETGDVLRVCQGHLEGVYCCHISCGVVVSGSGDGSLAVWDSATGAALDILDELGAEVHCVAADERFIVAGGADAALAVWSRSGAFLRRLKAPPRRGGHVGVVRRLFLRGRRLVSAGDCRGVFVWDVGAGTLLHQVHRQPISVKEMIVDDALIATMAQTGEAAVVAYW